MKKLSNALKKYQQDHHCTYDDLAKFLGLSKSTVYAYANELRNPNWNTLEKIAIKINKNILALIDTNDYERYIKLLDTLKKYIKVYEFIVKNPKKVQVQIKKMMTKNN